MNWQIQKECTDVKEYELVIEKQKRTYHCEQANQSWKWSVNYHGAQVATGTTNDMDAAKKLAEKNVPQ